MPHKRKFIVNRQTWRLHQFEFSVPCSYEDCLARLRVLEADLEARYLIELEHRLFRSPSFDKPSLKLERDDESSAFELTWHNVILSGTVQFITEDRTLFVGISQFKWDYPAPTPLYVIGLVLIVSSLAVASIPFLVAYVSPNPNSMWSDSTIHLGLLSSLVPLIGALVLYFAFRIEVARAVNILIAAFHDCPNR